MKSQPSDYPALAFVDIETTGSHFDRDRITEIGIKDGESMIVVDQWCYLGSAVERIPQGSGGAVSAFKRNVVTKGRMLAHEKIN